MANCDFRVSVCIPARYGSSRFPGKPLVKLAGKPLIQHAYESARQVTQVGQILVVTDHEAIVQTVKDFGGEACMVTEPCRTGTDRVAKAASALTYDAVINLQADEILLHPVGKWYHVALVVDDGKMVNYVNGKVELEGDLDFGPINTGETSIGVRLNRVSWFKGAVYTVLITPRALNPDEFTRH